ncbi:MAG TPA: amino acid ABC transporter permease [Terrimicrobiaceae bacterium]|nr:amino acid ABC transporter permease [Terrimicrobiaceae bacterium]
MSRLLGSFLDGPRSPAPLWARIVTLGFLLAVFSLLCWTLLASTTRNWEAIWKYRNAFWQGWMLTVAISLLSLVLSTLIGLVAALARRSNILLIRYLAIAYIECVRGMPLLVLILVLFYVVANALHIADRFLVGVVVLSLFAGAYIAEIIRSGIESVGASQRESARAIGLTTPQTYRYVIFPQALRQVLPPLAGQFASIVKDSSLLSIIGLAEFTYTAQQVNSATYSTLESYLPLAVGYLVLTLPISLWTNTLRKSMRYET